MTAEITRLQESKSKYGGHFLYLFFKKEDGRPAKTCLYPKYRNFARWTPAIKAFSGGARVELVGLREKKPGLIDADSQFEMMLEVG